MTAIEENMTPHADPLVTGKTIGTAVDLLLLDAASALRTIRAAHSALIEDDTAKATLTLGNFLQREHGLDNLDALLARSVPVAHEAVSGYG